MITALTPDPCPLSPPALSCGLMLTLATNLILWMTAVAEESVHHTDIPEDSYNSSKLSGRRMYILRGHYNTPTRLSD